MIITSDTDLAHVFPSNLVQRFPVVGAEFDEILVDILGDQLQAARRELKANHGQGWVFWFLAGTFPGQAFGRRDDPAEEESDRLEQFPPVCVPWVETSCEDVYSSALRRTQSREQSSADYGDLNGLRILLTI